MLWVLWNEYKIIFTKKIKKTSFTVSRCVNKKLGKDIANNLVQNWEIANQLVRKYGGNFYAILEPHMYFTNTKLDPALDKYYIPIYKEEMKYIYGIIEKLGEEKNYFINFKSIFNDIEEEYIFIDGIHISPNGNKIIAENVYKIMF